MRHSIYLLVAMIATLSATASCNVETSNNGKLDGFWHLVQVDTLATGGVNDLSEYKFFWSVQRNLIDASDHLGGNRELLFTFVHTGDSLILSNPCFPVWDGDDTPIDNLEPLRPFGINSLDQKFLIESMSGGKMILRDDSVRLGFRKQ